MSIRLKHIILTFFLFSAFSSKAQLVGFTSDTTIFFSEMKGFLMESNKKVGEEFMERFAQTWFDKKKLSEKQRQGIYAICNLMYQKQYTAFPDFQNYLYAIENFANSSYLKEDDFYAWQDVLVEMLDKRKTPKFVEFLEICGNLFEKGLIYKSSSVEWYVGNATFSFHLQKGVPWINFSKLDLKCYARGDSSIIENTSGDFYPLTAGWEGKGGTVNWLRAGFDPEEVYAELDNYQIELRSSNFDADSVTFYNYFYFPEPLQGKLTEKVLANVTTEEASYPRFESYDKRLTISQIIDSVDYEGGFALHGNKVIGKGDEQNKAKIIVYKKNKPFFVASSLAYIIRSDNISAENASIIFYVRYGDQGVDKLDSIYHQGLLFKFFLDKRSIQLIRDNKGLAISPYFNTYHRVDMDFRALYWAIDEPFMLWQNVKAGSKSDITFTSADYFDEYEYEKLQALDNVHPLVRIKDAMEYYDTDRITLDQMVHIMKMSPTQVELMLMTLTNKGYLIYDYDNKVFQVKERLMEAVKRRSMAIDYDVLEIFSDVKGTHNAKWNLINWNIEIDGVTKVELSDSQNVYLYPHNDHINFKRDRDFDFAGHIHAGRFDFYGKDFEFVYSRFLIELRNTDSLKIAALSNDVDRYGRKYLTPVNSVIQGINGNLLIDHPDNKSGYKPFNQYPLLNSFKESYVYYDNPKIQGGQYKKDKMYFQIDPFSIDSLDNFRNEQLRFDGMFFSGGIFPDFRETLTLQEDYSLGFIRPTPADGYPMYNGKGRFYDDIRLSNQGLRGSGKLEYLNSTTWSEDFIFFPDSMNAVAQKTYLQPLASPVEYPLVRGQDVFARWHPFDDVMHWKSGERPINMYENGSYLHGELHIEPSGVTGTGRFQFKTANLEAKKITFLSKVFTSDTADFWLTDSTLSEGVAFKTHNVKAFVSFEERYGEFTSNGGGSFIDFPHNRYICFMDKFKWYMDKDELAVGAGIEEEKEYSPDMPEAELNLEGSEFISVHPEQDSLRFFSPEAVYDIRNKRIDAKGVKYLVVADARIFPDSGKLTVLKNAEMVPLTNAQVSANYITKYHSIYNANIQVLGGKKYRGSGYVDYTNEMDEKLPIFLEEVGVDSTIQTYGKGNISSNDVFQLNPRFDYHGNVLLTASNQFLNFTGYAKPIQNCKALGETTPWFRFREDIDPLNVYIPIDTGIRDMNDRQLFIGVSMTNEPTTMYSSFFTYWQKYSDHYFLQPTGYVHYHKGSGEFRISSKDKINETSFSGDYLSFNPEYCKLYSEGHIDMGIQSESFGIQTVGNVRQDMRDSSVVFDLLMKLNYFIEASAMDQMAKIFSEKETLEPVPLDREVYEKCLKELIDSNEADKVIADLALYGEFKKIPKELEGTLVFNDLKLKWYADQKVYKSMGRIGVSNIDKKQINKYVQGKIKIEKNKIGDEIDIYLELDPNTWFYINYTRNIMQIISSDEVFNTIIKNVKPDKRKMPLVFKGQDPFQFMYSTPRKKDDFLKKF